MRAAVSDMSDKERHLIIWASLLALFLGALDALVMSAAMPSVVADLGKLSLYGWVYSAYFLTRAVSLPVFGKLADVYSTRSLFLVSIIVFVLASFLAGMASNMEILIVGRTFQGVGAGGNFALVYIVLSEVSPPGKRAKTLSMASSIWGISSVIGPTLGGIIVTYFSWRWIFFINIPIGLCSFAGIALFLRKDQKRKDTRPELDLLGIILFTFSILGLLTIFMTGGRELKWESPSMVILCITTLVGGIAFIFQEMKAANPMINLQFFTQRNFFMGNSAIFMASFTIFSFFAYAPLYIQGSLGLSPIQVGLAMVALSLGWSFGALVFGRSSSGNDEKIWSIIGGAVLIVGTLLTLNFDLETSMIECFFDFFIIGVGMGFVSLSTLIVIQNDVDDSHLGIATSIHQFGRSLGGTVGVGICGGLVTASLLGSLENAGSFLSPSLYKQVQESSENLLRAEFYMQLPPEAVDPMKNMVLSSVYPVFYLCIAASVLCILCCICLASAKK